MHVGVIIVLVIVAMVVSTSFVMHVGVIIVLVIVAMVVSTSFVMFVFFMSISLMDRLVFIV
jgi:hypothetical protein